MSYNLDTADNQPESFDFILGGNTYHFRYPTTEEVAELAKLRQADGTPDADQIMKAVYAFISPADQSAPSVEEALNKSRIQKFREFQHMMIVELGLQES